MNQALAVIEANWQIYGGIALLALLIGWWLLARTSQRTRDRSYKPDVLDEGVGPAQRNQALIDAAPAAQVVMPPVPPLTLTPAEPLPERRSVPEVIAEPAPMPGLDQAASPDQTAAEEQRPDSVSAPDVAPEPAPEPTLEPVPAPIAAPPQTLPTGDDLAKIKGLGPKLQSLLLTLGLSTYAQIAALTEADLVALDPKLGPFAGRPARDGWVEQAKYLAAGDVAGFEARFGKV